MWEEEDVMREGEVPISTIIQHVWRARVSHRTSLGGGGGEGRGGRERGRRQVLGDEAARHTRHALCGGCDVAARQAGWQQGGGNGG